MTKDRFGWILSGIDRDLLNPWEEKFVEDIKEKFDVYGDLTGPQEDKIEEIFKQKGR